VQLESALLACGFDEREAKIIVADFLSGIANVGEALGRADQKVGEVLSEDQATEILTKSLDDCIAAMPRSERVRIDLKMLERAFGYR
jgi:hypothetical protein